MMRYHEVLVTIVFDLALVALVLFQGGCQWEETVDVNAAGKSLRSTFATCSGTYPKRVAIAYFEDMTWEELSDVRALAHLAGSPYGTHVQERAYVEDNRVFVPCESEYDYVIFAFATYGP